MVRTFRIETKVNLDVQIATTNALNHVTYTGWITNINSTQFGLPEAANPMRSIQTSLRLRF
jgi:trimeric autotransporter adhesin